jgi:hypothetical protein
MFWKSTVVRMLRLTDAFIWEDLPRTDPETGSLAMAAWFPLVQRGTTFINDFVTIFPVSSLRFSASNYHPLFYEAHYPFDTTKSPSYK